MSGCSKPLRYVDVSILRQVVMEMPWLILDQIGINLSDPVFRGEYHGRQVHDSDMDDIIQRARDIGCEKFMVTGSDLEESRRVMELSRNYCESSRSLSCLAPLNDSNL